MIDLKATGWHVWGPEQYLADDQLTVVLDDTLSRPALRHARRVVRQVEDITGIDTRQQNLWLMAGAVYDSLIVSGEIDEKKASYFNHMEDGPAMLSEFRFASADELRGEAANYIIDNGLEAEVQTPLSSLSGSSLIPSAFTFPS